MITRHELERRLHLARRALDHRHVANITGNAATRAELAAADIAKVLAPGVIARAHRHLADHQAGYPASSVPTPGGKGGLGSDRTGWTAVGGRPGRHRDPVLTETRELEERTARLERDTIQLLRPGADTHRLTKRIETDARQVRFTLLRWAREPDVRWCRSCQRNGHREPVAHGKYADACRGCGDWRRVNKAFPPKDILPYLQRRQPIPQPLLDRHRVKLPRPRKVRPR